MADPVVLRVPSRGTAVKVVRSPYVVKYASGRDGIAGTNGTNGTNGQDGKSNYQLWLDAGNTGTLDDYFLTLKGEKGDPGGAESKQVFTPTNGQTVFTLSTAATFPAISKLFINGSKYTYSVDYTLDSVTLTWISASFSISSSDRVEIFYI